MSSSVGLLPQDYDEIKLDSVIRRLTEYTVRARKDMSRPSSEIYTVSYIDGETIQQLGESFNPRAMDGEAKRIAPSH